MTPPAGAAAARPLVTERLPRSAARPARGAVTARGIGVPPVRRRARARSATPSAPGLAHTVARVCDHRLLDRLIRGRAWIGLVGFALIGIVAMQLALLKLNTGIGRDLRVEAQLQRENAGLQADVSSLSAVDRVQALASRLGMVLAAPGSVRFLSARADPGARRATLALDAHAPLSAAPAAAGAGGPATGASAALAPAGAPSTLTSTGPAPAPASAARAPAPTPSSVPTAPAAPASPPAAPVPSGGGGGGTGSAVATPAPSPTAAASTGGAGTPVTGG